MFGRITEWFQHHGGSGEQRSVDEQIQSQLDNDAGWGSVFLAYLLIVTILFVVCLSGFWVGLDFLSIFGVGAKTINTGEGILFLGSIVFIVLLLLPIVGRIFHREVLDEHSYRDDQNPHIREIKEKLRERK